MMIMTLKPWREEEQDGELYPFYKHQNLKCTFAYNCKLHRYKLHGMTARKVFYKKLKEGKVGF